MKSKISIACHFTNGDKEVFTFEPIEGKDRDDIDIKAVDAFFSPKRTMLYSDGYYYLKNQVVKLKVIQQEIYEEKQDETE